MLAGILCAALAPAKYADFVLGLIAAGLDAVAIGVLEPYSVEPILG